MTDKREHSAWLEVNLDALVHNYRQVEAAAPGALVIPVIKANAYGLGDIACGRLFSGLGARMLAVTTVQEAIRLREAGLVIPILLLAPFAKNQTKKVIDYQLTPAISMAWQVESLAEHYQGETPLAIQLKLETGLGRTGLNETQLTDLLARLKPLTNITVEGYFSHLADASNASYTQRQIDIFASLGAIVGKAYPKTPLISHLANSLAILDVRQSHYAAVRPGTILYGQHPAQARARLSLKNPCALYARVLSTQIVATGSSIGYGLDVVAKKPTRIAVLSIGYADGLLTFPRRYHETLARRLKGALGGWYKQKTHKDGFAQVNIKGKDYPLIGRVAMQMCMVAIDETVEVGDIARLSMLRLMISSRLPRIYTMGGEDIPVDKIDERMAYE